MPLPLNILVRRVAPSWMAMLATLLLVDWVRAEDVSLDIGSSGGRTTIQAGMITVESSGYDTWDRWDAFRFAAQRPLAGEGQAIVCLTEQAVTDPWCKAGIMVRDGLDADAHHVMVMVAGGKTVAVQWRTTDGPGCSSFVVPGEATFPMWLRIKREAGQDFTAWRSADGITWTKLEDPTGRTITLAGVPTTLTAGLAVTSHHTDVASSATFAGWSVLSTPWETADIGTVSAPGNVYGSEKDGFIITSTGFDVWDVADAYRMLWREVATDGTLTVRVAAQDVKDDVEWRKAGIMLREGTDAQARYAMVTVADGNKVTFQWRDAAGGASAWDGQRLVRLPVWLQLVRRQGNVMARYSTDGSRWSTFDHTWASTTAGSCQVGMAVTSHVTGESASATFDHLVWKPTGK